MSILRSDTRYCIDTLLQIAKITTNQNHRERLCAKAETLLLECMQAKTIEELDIEKQAYMQSNIRKAIIIIAHESNDKKLRCCDILNIAERNNIYISESAVEIGRIVIKWRQYFYDIDGIQIKSIKNGTGSKCYKFIKKEGSHEYEED